MHTGKRIAIILPDLRIGGGQRVLLSLARQFAVLGFVVDIVSLLDEGELIAELPEECGYFPLLLSQRRMAWGGVPRLVRYLRHSRPAAVLSSMTGTNLLVASAYKLAGVTAPLLLREAASFVNLRNRFFPRLMSICYRSASAVIAVSEGVAHDLATLGLDDKRIHVINNPVDAEKLFELAQATNFDTWRPRVPYVVSIGRLVEQKDHRALIRAYAQCRLKESHRLVIVGDGELRPQLVELSQAVGVASQIDWTGTMKNPYGVLSQASLLVLSSRWEGYPNVLLEALALGVPVVATDCPAGPRELLADGRYGRLVPVNDSDALAQAMDAELKEPSGNCSEVISAHKVELVARKYLALMGMGPPEAEQ